MGNGWENFPQEDSDKNMIRKVKNFYLVPGDLKTFKEARSAATMALLRCLWYVVPVLVV